MAKQHMEKEELVLRENVMVEGFKFTPTLSKPPPGSDSTNTFILGGAGVRGLQIQDRFIKFTAIGIYLEQDKAIPALSLKWKSKTADELVDSVQFYRDIVTGPFEKFMMVTMIMPLTGQQYSEKVAENCVAIWKAMGIYTAAEGKAVQEFLDIFKDETFPPSSSILFTQDSPTLTISFSKDGSIPEEGNTKIVNKHLSEAILESMIGEHGVSPDAKKSLAVRLSELMKMEGGAAAATKEEDGAQVEEEHEEPVKV